LASNSWATGIKEAARFRNGKSAAVRQTVQLARGLCHVVLVEVENGGCLLAFRKDWKAVESTVQLTKLVTY